MIRIKHGKCEFCERSIALTFHHLIPKKMHRRAHFKKAHSKTTLNAGVNICRRCHTGIHKLYDEMTLAKNLYTADLLRSDEALARHFKWVAKQKS